MIKARNKELAIFRKHKTPLYWFTPTSAEKVKEIGVGGTYEAYKM